MHDEYIRIMCPFNHLTTGVHQTETEVYKGLLDANQRNCSNTQRCLEEYFSRTMVQLFKMNVTWYFAS